MVYQQGMCPKEKVEEREGTRVAAESYFVDIGLRTQDTMEGVRQQVDGME